MSEENEQERNLQLTDSETRAGRDLESQFPPTASITPRTRAVFRYNKRWGWQLEFFGDKAAARRALEDSPAVKRRKKRSDFKFRANVIASAASAIIRDIIREIKKIPG